MFFFSRFIDEKDKIIYIYIYIYINIYIYIYIYIYTRKYKVENIYSQLQKLVVKKIAFTKKN